MGTIIELMVICAIFFYLIPSQKRLNKRIDALEAKIALLSIEGNRNIP